MQWKLNLNMQGHGWYEGILDIKIYFYNNFFLEYVEAFDQITKVLEFSISWLFFHNFIVYEFQSVFFLIILKYFHKIQRLRISKTFWFECFKQQNYSWNVLKI